MDLEKFIQNLPEQSDRGIDNLHEEYQQRFIESLHSEAITFHQKKRWAEAEQMYQKFLAEQPNHAIGWANLGTLYYEAGNYDSAFQALAKSLEIDNSRSQSHYAIAQVLERVGDLPQAILAYEYAVKLDGSNLEALNNLGNAFQAVGDYAKAISSYQQAIAINPQHYGSYLNLGNILLQSQQIDRAISTYEIALKLNPSSDTIPFNLAIAHQIKGNVKEAHYYQAYAFYREQKYAEAIAEFYQYLQLQAGTMELYCDLHECLVKINRESEGLNALHTAIQLYPRETDLYIRLSKTLLHCGRSEEALTFAQDVSKTNPDNLDLYFHAQLMLPPFYQTSEEIYLWRQRFIIGLQNVIDRVKLDTAGDRQAALQAISRDVNFLLCYQAQNDVELQSRYGQLVHKIMSVIYPQWMKPLNMPALKNGQKIRIGYISYNMCAHAGTSWAVGWLKHCNKDLFEIYGYHVGTRLDATTQVFRLYFDKFHHFPDDLETASTSILSHELHILMFLDIGMHPFTTKMSALRLAPVQGTTWGHPLTSGIPNIDYYLSGELTEPDNGEEHYSEQLVRLPNIAISYPRPSVPQIFSKSRSDFDFQSHEVIYLCCQMWCKYLPQHDYIFAAIAQQVPNAKFVFVEPEFKPNRSVMEKFTERLQSEFAKLNLQTTDYVRFLPRQSNYADYMSLLNSADIFLDTIGFSGGHTTLEAIACNLPIVTLPQEFMRGRQSYGFLSLLGVTETIASKEVEYIEIAVKLGLRTQWRSDIQQKMKERQVYLYDDRVCVSGLESWYQTIVLSHLSP